MGQLGLERVNVAIWRVHMGWFRAYNYTKEFTKAHWNSIGLTGKSSPRLNWVKKSLMGLDNVSNNTNKLSWLRHKWRGLKRCSLNSKMVHIDSVDRVTKVYLGSAGLIDKYIGLQGKLGLKIQKTLQAHRRSSQHYNCDLDSNKCWPNTHY